MKKSNLIGISGKMFAGKDTVGKTLQYLTAYKDFNECKSMLLREFELNCYCGYYGRWEIKKFAGNLKKIASILTGIPERDFEKQDVKNSYLPDCWNTIENGQEKQMTVRKLLQVLGTDAIRVNLHKDTWVNSLFSEFDTKTSNWIITDVRFENEAKAIKDRGGILINVKRDIQTDKLNDHADINKHSSENGLINYEFDYVIDNNGTKEELVDKIVAIFPEIKNKLNEN